MTLFIWTPRIGQLSAIRDGKVTQHYLQQMDAQNLNGGGLMGVPSIAGTFNGWHYQKMREIVSFVEENDNDKPDFAKMCLDELILKPW